MTTMNTNKAEDISQATNETSRANQGMEEEIKQVSCLHPAWNNSRLKYRILVEDNRPPRPLHSLLALPLNQRLC